MKLWLKISIICICVLLLTVSISSTILILMSRDNILKQVVDSALTEESNLQVSFSGMMEFYGSEDLEPVVKQSMAKYCFSRYAQETSVLLSGDETIYSNISIEPEKLLNLKASTQQEHYTGNIDGRDILIVGNKVKVLNIEYSVYTVRDITAVFSSIDNMIWRFVFISAFCILVGVTLIVFLVRFAMRPLKSLGNTARRIAKGDYNERVEINTHDEVGDLAQDFNMMAAAVQCHINELQENAERQLLFMGGLTHEFKTPLTSVIGHSETLLYTKLPEEVVENSLTHIHEQCKWLERLTQKLLRLITLQERLELKEEYVEDLLEALKGSMEESLRQREINLEITCDHSRLNMDFDLMLSLMINLVDNAAKASRAGQKVRIAAHKNIIEVSDEGIGISKEDISRIFDPFYMVDPSRSKLKGGSGLGLALVKRIADAHGAQISVESIQEQGTTMKISFPVYN